MKVTRISNCCSCCQGCGLHNHTEWFFFFLTSYLVPNEYTAMAGRGSLWDYSPCWDITSFTASVFWVKCLNLMLKKQVFTAAFSKGLQLLQGPEKGHISIMSKADRGAHRCGSSPPWPLGQRVWANSCSFKVMDNRCGYRQAILTLDVSTWCFEC